MVNISLYVYNHLLLSIHLFKDWGQLGCFHALAIVNKAAMNIEVHVSFQISFSSQICTQE